MWPHLPPSGVRSSIFVRAISEELPRPRFLAENANRAHAANGGISLIDADDLWASTKLEKQITMMAEGGREVGLVYCWYAIIDAEAFIKAVAKPTSSGQVLSHLCENNFVGMAARRLCARM